jgi:hypothetical protein
MEPMTTAAKVPDPEHRIRSIASGTWSDVVRAMRAERVSDDHAMAWADIIRIDLEDRLRLALSVTPDPSLVPVEKET